MRVIKLYGELGKKYGKLHRFLVGSPAEAIRALCANFPDFQRDMITAEDRNIGH
jgi:predicted phage tail protein